MKIAISGYGRMGKSVEQIALNRGHQISCVIDKAEDWKLKEKLLRSADIIIDFSLPDVVVDNILKAFSLGIPIVTGTTAWDNHRDQVIAACQKQNACLFYASNFSIGMNIFMAANSYLAQMMDAYENYEVSIEETHHIHKNDAPSGTAISLAEGIISQLSRKESWVCNKENSCKELRINAHRFDEVPGTHEISYTGAEDELLFVHRAKNRNGFAKGAVVAAEWVLGKKGVFTMTDLIKV